MSMTPRFFRSLPAALLALGLGFTAQPGMAADAAKAKTDAKTKAAVVEDDAETLRQLEIQQGGRWKGTEQPVMLDPKTLKADEQKLYQRVMARWAALVAFDLPKVYSFATPSYRKTHDQLHLNGQYHNKLMRTGVDVFKIDFVDEQKTQAKVRVKLKFQQLVAGVGQPVEGASWETDTWVKEGGQWWYVEAK